MIAEVSTATGVNSLTEAAVLGIVQGLTEFLPISSTAHLRIVPQLVGWGDPGAPFSAVIQLGTTAAVLLYFWRELVHIVVGWFRGLRDPSARSGLDYRYGWYLILATIPVAVLGLVFSDQIETGARNLWVISTALIALALVLAGAERVSSRKRGEEDLDGRDATVVGAAQALSLIPGVSRSGATISAGLFRGLDRAAAARFSFLLSVPAVLLSGLYEARHIGDPSGPGIGYVGVGLVLAFAVGLASIAWLMRFLTRHSTYLFVAYRIALGVALLALLATGAISATD